MLSIGWIQSSARRFKVGYTLGTVFDFSGKIGSERMKIFISVDIEGVACVTHGDHCKLEGPEYEMARK